MKLFIKILAVLAALTGAGILVRFAAEAAGLCGHNYIDVDE